MAGRIVKKLLLRLKLKSRYTGSKFERYKLKCSDLEAIIKLIDRSNCYFVGHSIPILNSSNIYFILTDKAKEAYIALLEGNKQVIDYEIKNNYFAIIKIRGKYSDFVSVFTTEIPQFNTKKGNKK